MCGVTLERGEVWIPDGLEAKLARKLAWLERMYPELQGCSVSVSGPGPDARHAGFRFRLTFKANDQSVAVCGQAHAQASAALSSALDAANRRLGERLRGRLEGRAA